MEGMEKCGSRAGGRMGGLQFSTISYEIRGIKSGDVEKREISGSCVRVLCFARAWIHRRFRRAKSECERDTRTMNPRAEWIKRLNFPASRINSPTSTETIVRRFRVDWKVYLAIVETRCNINVGRPSMRIVVPFRIINLCGSLLI